ncbi:TPM domain-containing protein [Thermodesulfobacteriota bacterium]
MKKALFLALVLVSFFIVPVAMGVDVPYLTGRVTDDAKLLSTNAHREITEILKAHEEKTTNQITVLTVESLEGESIEEYAVAVFEEWKLGQKGKDNGILVIVAPKERRMRIEVGYGLEGPLPDARAGDIIRNYMTPRFKKGDYNGGIKVGVMALVSVLEGGKLPKAEKRSRVKKKSSSGLQIKGPNLSIIERILLGAFIFGIIGLFTFLGIVTPGMGWFLYFFLIPFWAMFPTIIVGSTGALYCLVTYLIGFPVAKVFLKKTEWYKKARKDIRTKGRASIGGFVFGTRGGSGSSWSSGGSSFSGGGGSSGGGGASGSW